MPLSTTPERAQSRSPSTATGPVSCRSPVDAARGVRPLVRWWLWAGMLAACWLGPRESARAEEQGRRLVVLHRGGDDVPLQLRNEVDHLVLSAVAEHVRLAQAYGSEVPYEDIELAAGCTARGADCMQRIAASLDADWILVRELVRDRNGIVYLTLIAHDGPEAIVTRRAVAQLGEGERDPVGVVPMLIGRLYPSDTQGEPNTNVRSPARVFGWSSAALGSGLLAAGAAMGALSQRDHRTYKDAHFQIRDDVDRAADALDRAQKRARLANGLLISGAAASAAGAAALLWSYLKPRPDARQVRVGLTPSRSGVALSIAGAWQGGL